MAKKKKLFCEISPLTYAISLQKEIWKRHLKNWLGKERYAKEKRREKLPVVVFGHKERSRDRPQAAGKQGRQHSSGLQSDELTYYPPGRNVLILGIGRKNVQEEWLHGGKSDYKRQSRCRCGRRPLQSGKHHKPPGDA